MALNPTIGSLTDRLQLALQRLELIKLDLDNGLINQATAKTQAQTVLSFIQARTTELQTAINNLP